jgi:hypothetical protein
MEKQRELVLAHLISNSTSSRALLGQATHPLRSTTAPHLPNHPATVEKMFNAECVCRTLEAEKVQELSAVIRHRHVTSDSHLNHEAPTTDFSGPTKNVEYLNGATRKIQARTAPSFTHLAEHVPLRSNCDASFQGERHHMTLPMSYNPFAKLSRIDVPTNMRAEQCGDGRRAVLMSKEEEEEFAAYLFLKQSAFKVE